MSRSLWFRLLVTSLVWMGLTLGLAWVGLGRLFDHHVTASHERQLADRLNLIAASLEWDDLGRLVLQQAPADPRYQSPFSGKYWQVDDGRTGSDPAAGSAAGAGAGVGASAASPLDRSRSLWDEHLSLPPPASPAQGLRVTGIEGPQQQRLLVVDRTLTLPGSDRPVRIAVAMDRGELLAARREFDRLLALALLALAVGLSLLVVAQIAIGLRPLRRLRESLGRLATQSTRQLPGEWPREIAPLVRALNVVWARDAETIARSRRQAADLAHGLKTPLAVLGNLAATGPQVAPQVASQVDVMRRQIDRHLARARAVGRSGLAGASTDAGRALGELVGAMRTLHRDREIDLHIDDEVRFDGDRQDLIEMGGNLLENACLWARSRIEVSLSRADEGLLVQVLDDGPGMTDAQLDAFTTGRSPIDQRGMGSGLGLSICAEIAALYEGRLRLCRGERGGLLARLWLPRAQD